MINREALWRRVNRISVYNLRLRVAQQPAVTKELYDTQMKSEEPTRRQNDSDKQRKKSISSQDTAVESDFISEDLSRAESDVPKKVPPTQCLFCNLESPTLDANIDHMSSLHGLFIPSPGQLSDTESFLGYLAIIIFEYKECLYCSLEKGTVDGVQAHMRDKGHC